MNISKQQEHVKELLKLIEENPDLKIVAMVDTDVVADDCYAWWVGSFGKAEIDEIYSDGERVYLRSKDEDILIDRLYDDMEDNGNLSDDEAYELAKEKVLNYRWEKVITVKIGLP